LTGTLYFPATDSYLLGMPGELDDSPTGRARRRFGAIAVDRGGEVPVGVQLAWALRAGISEGQLTPGERLPGLREMAQTSGLNVNTVRAVYQRLEQEGLIDSQQGSGTFIAAAARSPSPVSSIAASAARAAAETGVDPREVAAALYVSHGLPPADSGIERRRALRAQIAALERTLGEMEATHPGLAPDLAGKHASSGPSLLSAAELERVRTQLVRRLSVLQARIDAEGGQDEQKPKPKRSPRGAVKPAKAVTPAKSSSNRTRPPRASTRPAAAGT
jgi:DNA-binding transcriptional regulator YhcF (GntR family)